MPTLKRWTVPLAMPALYSRTSLLTVRRAIDKDVDPVVERFRLDEAEVLLVSRLSEETFAGADDDRVDHQAELVHEVVLDQRLRQLRTAVNDDVALVPLLELRDRLDHVAVEHSRVVTVRVLQSGEDDVLGQRVELVGELALDVRPHRRKG